MATKLQAHAHLGPRGPPNPVKSDGITTPSRRHSVGTGASPRSCRNHESELQEVSRRLQETSHLDTQDHSHKQHNVASSPDENDDYASLTTQDKNYQWDDSRQRRKRSSPTKWQSKPVHRKNIGDWIFVETVGSGSMGKVKLAQHSESGNLCAVKVVVRAAKNYLHKQTLALPPQTESEVNLRRKRLEKDVARDRRTIREASLGAVMCHPQICQLYEMHTFSNHYYMLFEYISGGQLLDYIVQHGVLKESVARKFSRSIASAVDYLHSHNIVHRDLKIENMMITEKGEIKLIDFGLSNFYDARNKLKTFCGSLYFAAPELLSATPYVGPEIDIWSFGVIIYVMICGKVPFDDDNSNALHEKIKNGKVIYPHHLSIDVISLLSRMLNVDPAARCTLKQVIKHPWMTRGYSKPLQSYCLIRDPLTVESLDNTVIEEMVSLKFAEDAAQAKATIVELITKPSYLHLARKQRDMLLELKRSSNSDDPAVIFSKFEDPLLAYHPMVSLYHLVNELLERSKSNNYIRSGDEEVYAKGYYSAMMEVLHKIPDSAPSLCSDHSTDTLQTGTRSLIVRKGTQLKKNCAKLVPSKPSISSRSDDNKSYGNDLHKISSSESDNHDKSASPQSHNNYRGIFGSFFRRLSSRHERTPIKLENSTSRSDALSTGKVQEKKASQNNITRTNDNIRGRTHTRAVSDGQPNNVPFEANCDQINEETPFAHFMAHNGHQDLKRNNDAQLKEDFSSDSRSRRFHPATRARSVGHARPDFVKLDTMRHLYDDENKNEPIAYEGKDNLVNRRIVFKNINWASTIANQTLPAEKILTEREIIEQADNAPPGTMLSLQSPKIIPLKGFFSVQTTSSKSIPVVRYNLISVLRKRNIEYKEIVGGFLCVKNVAVTVDSTLKTEQPSNENRLENVEGSRENSKINQDKDNETTCQKSNEMTEFNSDDDKILINGTEYDDAIVTEITKSNSNSSETSNTSSPVTETEERLAQGSSSGPLIEDYFSKSNDVHVNEIKMVRTPLKFEVRLVKVPMVALSGIQFQKISGNPWVYKELATQIIKDLNF